MVVEQTQQAIQQVGVVVMQEDRLLAQGDLEGRRLVIRKMATPE